MWYRQRKAWTIRKVRLAAKSPESIEGGRVLGLKLKRDKMRKFVLHRGNKLPNLKQNMNRRELFSMCEMLVGHNLVSGWLKRRARVNWSEKVGEKMMVMMQEVLEGVQAQEKARGGWHVSDTKKGVVWRNTSNIALRVILEIGVEVEDAIWLKKKDDYNHINVAKLDAVLRGVNLALR